MRFTVKVDLTQVTHDLASMEAAAAKLRPVWGSLRKPMRDDQSDHARKQAGPEGKWPKNAASTIERRQQAKRGRRRAMKAAKTKSKFSNARRQFRAPKLMGSMPNRTVKVQTLGGDGLQAISKVAWSGVQQDGGRVGRGSRIPARPFLWLSDGFMAKATDAIETHLVGAF